VAAKVSLRSNTAGVVTVALWDVTTSASLATTTITIGATGTETVGAATFIQQQVTNLGDVLTIRVKHSVNGATVTLNSGGIIEGDVIGEATATSYKQLGASATSFWISSFKYYVLGGFSTASYTGQLVTTSQLCGAFQYYNIATSSSTINSLLTPTLTYKIYMSGQSVIQLNVSALSGQILIACAYGLSMDNQ
jgi:hypothetical protein